MNKYFKPTSLTWWASVVPLALGVVLALEPIHGNLVASDIIHNLTGDMSAAALINIGLGGIGLRGAIG